MQPSQVSIGHSQMPGYTTMVILHTNAVLTTSPPTRCDSVMPGSLGLEAMHQTLELWCVHAGLGGGKRDATFSHELGKTAWKYRGQLTPKAERCDVEVHVLTNPYPNPNPNPHPSPNPNPNPHQVREKEREREKQKLLEDVVDEIFDMVKPSPTPTPNLNPT